MINPPPFAQAMFTRPGVLSREWWQWLNKIHKVAEIAEDALPAPVQDASAEAESYAEYAMLAGIKSQSEQDDPKDVLNLSYRISEIELAIDDILATPETQDQEFYVPPYETEEQETIPVGTVAAFRFAAIPKNWLELNGQTVNTADYPALALLYGEAGSTMDLDDWQDLPLWGDGVLTVGDVAGYDDRNIITDLSGDNTTWTGTGESVLTIADASATSTNVTIGVTAISHTDTHNHDISGGNHDHGIKTYEYQTTPLGGETVSDNKLSVLPKRAIVKWIIKAR